MSEQKGKKIEYPPRPFSPIEIVGISLDWPVFV